ncbi:aminopeptidase [Candidatus Woesearchaeota archaeon]|nr:aminopeptidase [Candidatus Woesearchaeota archaeon]
MISKEALRTVFEESTKLKPEESCLVVTDSFLKSVATPFYQYAKKISDNAKLHIIEPTGMNGAEPSQETASLMLGYDVVFLITKYSLSHTKARRDATSKGARINSMPGVTTEMINRCLDINYDELYEVNTKIRNKLLNSNKVRIITEKGGDITLSVTEVHGERGGYRDKPGDFGNLPCGEVDCGVRNANGVLVVDGSFPGLGLLRDEPVMMMIEDNIATSIEGDKANELIDMLEKVGSNAYKIAELGIGTNKKAIITGNVLEDEKVFGTVHFALGNDVSYGGKNDVPIHLDGVITKPTIIVDDEKIMDEGELLI